MPDLAPPSKVDTVIFQHDGDGTAAWGKVTGPLRVLYSVCGERAEIFVERQSADGIWGRDVACSPREMSELLNGVLRFGLHRGRRSALGG